MEERNILVKTAIERGEKEREESWKRARDAADQILQVSGQLHLTWSEFEQAVQLVKESAHMTN